MTTTFRQHNERQQRDVSEASGTLREFSAVVTDIRLESRVGGVTRWQMALDRTCFSVDSPLGVLVAVALSGARLEVSVLAVIEEGGVVWHVVDKPLTEGTPVTGRIEPAYGHSAGQG